VGGSDVNMKPDYTFLEERSEIFISPVLSFSQFMLATNNKLGYDMPRVKVKMIYTAVFCIDSNCSVCVRVIE